METFKLRAHHGMCLAFFIGKGYSSSFVENMWEKKLFLEENNPLVEIVCEADHICDACPNNHQGTCSSLEKVNIYDQSVLKLCGLNTHSILSWQEFSSLVKEKILDANKRESICADCSWNSICTNTKKKMR